MNNVTIIIKAFERPDCLKRLLNSLRHYYPTLPVLIADDSQVPQGVQAAHTTVYPLPFDSGLSAGRNYLLDRVTTEYFLLLDDDFIFNDKTDLTILHHILTTTSLDIIGGQVIDVATGPFSFCGIFSASTKSKRPSVRAHQYHQKYPQYVTCDFIPNFFMGRTAAVQKVRWDPDLKLSEHVDFFWRARNILRIGYCAAVQIQHHRGERPLLYSRMRSRGRHFYRLFEKKHGFAPRETPAQAKYTMDPVKVIYRETARIQAQHRANTAINNRVANRRAQRVQVAPPARTLHLDIRTGTYKGARRPR